MKTLCDIFNLIKSEKILLEEFKSLNISQGIYLNIPGLPSIIGVSPDLALNNHKKYKSLLSEELGHHFTSNGNLIKIPKNYYEKLSNSKKEIKARRWAADYLISNNDFINALNNCISNIYNMSEYFDVTEELIKYKIKSILTNEELYKKIKNNFMLKEIPYMYCNI